MDLKDFKFYRLITPYYFKPVPYKLNHQLYNGNLEDRYVHYGDCNVDLESRFVRKKNYGVSLRKRYAKSYSISYGSPVLTGKFNWDAGECSCTQLENVALIGNNIYSIYKYQTDEHIQEWEV